MEYVTIPSEFNNCANASRSQSMNSAMGTGQAIKVSPDQVSVCCRGASDAFGHPAVYLTFAEKPTVRCYYCGCEFKRASNDSGHLQKVD